MARRFSVLTAVLAMSGVLWTANASAATGIGQTATAIGWCTADQLWIESGTTGGASYTVPAGNWVLNSWSTEATGTSGLGAIGAMAVVVARPLGGGQYTIVGISATEPLVAKTLNTFSTSIQVQGGDVLGLWVDTSGGYVPCLDGSGGSTTGRAFVGGSEPTVGDTFTLSAFSYQIDVAANLTPRVTASASTPDSVFLCYSKWERDGGAVIPADQAQQLLASGWWLPTAVPGNVDGGDNLGGYHLECDPSDSLEPTGRCVDDGGDVLDASSAGLGSYAIKTGP